jgi:hypothetical protein
MPSDESERSDSSPAMEVIDYVDSKWRCEFPETGGEQELQTHHAEACEPQAHGKIPPKAHTFGDGVNEEKE